MKVISVEYLKCTMKFLLWENGNNDALAFGSFEGIGSDNCIYTIIYKNEKISENVVLNNYDDIVSYLVDSLIQLDFIYSIVDIKGIGHKLSRIYNHFSNYIVFSNDSLSKLKPLDDTGLNYETLGVQSFLKVFPESLNVGFFDYGFFNTLDMSHYLFSIPFQWYEKYGIRKYGIDGITHNYISNQVHELLHADSFKLVSCSLDVSNSICSINDGKAIDISSGFLDSSGIISSTGSGKIDPAIIPFIMECEGKNAGEILDDLNNSSGLLGISELSDDIKIILDSTEDNEKASLALDKYILDIVAEIAKAYVLLEGIDVLVFTSFVGENFISIRRKICEKLSCFGVKIDLDLNSVCGKIQRISSDDSKILVYVIPATDSQIISNHVFNMINR